MNLLEFIDNLINFYEKLLNKKINTQNSSWAFEKIQILKSFDKNKYLSNEQKSTILETFLYSVGFNIMAGNLTRTFNGNISKYELNNFSEIDNINNIRGELMSEKSPNTGSLLFESLVRAWYNQKFNTTFFDLEKCNTYKDGNKCEFIINFTEKNQLIECKKIKKSGNIIQNIEDNMEKANEQFNSVIEKDGENSVKHFLIDISELLNDNSYVHFRDCSNKTRKILFKEIDEEKTKNLINDIYKKSSKLGIDQVTLVSEKFFIVDGEKAGIIQTPTIIKEHEDVTNYDGWTVMGVKGKLFKEGIKTLEVLSTSDHENEIIALQDAHDGIFFYQGPAKDTK